MAAKGKRDRLIAAILEVLRGMPDSIVEELVEDWQRQVMPEVQERLTELSSAEQQPKDKSDLN